SGDQQQGGSSTAVADDPPHSGHPNFPDHPSFTSFPEGEGATNPDILPEPMLNKLYNKVLSLASSGKPSTLSGTLQQPQLQSSSDAKSPPQEALTAAGLVSSLGISHRRKNPSVSSVGQISETSSVISSSRPPLPS